MFRVRYSEVRSHLAPGWGQDNGETRRQRNCSRERAKLRGSQLVREDISQISQTSQIIDISQIRQISQISFTDISVLQKFQFYR